MQLISCADEILCIEAGPRSAKEIGCDGGGLACRPRKQMPTDPLQAIEFAQSKGQARKDGRTGITFADVAGCDEAVRELKFVVEVNMLVYKSEEP